VNEPKFQTVQGVRNMGHKVNVFHLRRYERDVMGGKVVELLPACCVPEGKMPLSKGGLTAVKITFEDGSDVTGFAECSNSEAYNRKRGVRIALNRAVASMKS
jgi:hypothetical protein